MEKKILMEISARHVHLTDADVSALFGAGSTLTVKKELSQPGQFICEERVKLVGPKKSIDNVGIIGPTRAKTQVEISLTDARTLGINALVRESGHLDETAGCKIVGPCGEVELNAGVIAAQRHVHLTPETAAAWGIENGAVVRVKTDGERALTFENAVVRVSDAFADCMHVDTDEANAAGLVPDSYGVILD